MADLIKVALIEDDVDIVSMYTKFFELAGGFEVQSANDGASGIVLVQSFNPDVILLDMMMPKMSGIETLDKLRRLPGGDKYKIIALTNMNDPDTVAKIHHLGADDFLVKANTPAATIQQRVKDVLGKSVSA